MASTGSLGALAFYNNSIISGDLASVSACIEESPPDILECRTTVCSARYEAEQCKPTTLPT